MKTEMTIIDPKEFGIEEQTALNLTEGLKPHLDERALLIEEFEKIKDLEFTKENIPAFRELRLKFRDNRTKGINKWHEVTKKVPLRMGQLIDAIKNKEISVNETHEEFLERGEKHFEKLEAERLQKLRSDRWEEIKTFIEIEPAGLDTMEQDVFDAFKSGLKAKHDAKIEAERLAEAEKQKQIEIQNLTIERRKILAPYYEFILDQDKDRNWGEIDEETFTNNLNTFKKKKSDHDAEQEKIRIENERLKQQAEAREKELQAEKAKADAERKAAEAKAAKIKAEADAKLKAEQQAKAKLEAELKAKADAEEKARIDAEKKAADELKAKQLEEEKAAKAPDKVKLKNWVNGLVLPAAGELKSNESKLTAAEIAAKFAAFKKWANSEIEKL